MKPNPVTWFFLGHIVVVVSDGRGRIQVVFNRLPGGRKIVKLLQRLPYYASYI